VRKRKTCLHWSSGKDSALALYDLQQEDTEYDTQLLLTTVSTPHDRVSMHGLRKELLLAQVAAIGMPVKVVELPPDKTNKAYEKCMAEAVAQLTGAGYECTAFGDIFLADLRAYREVQFAGKGMEAIFPLWGSNTRELASRFLQTGFKAIVVAVDAAKLDPSFVGRPFDESFLADLPAGLDPCGENGEFHTFCYDGPLFRQPILFQKGEIVYREYPLGEGFFSGFWYCDLI
jgi:uncharacterized protein (TIGR00290 family)